MCQCLLAWANSIPLFLRSFRKAREAADRGESVIVKGENGDYVFEAAYRLLQCKRQFEPATNYYGHMAGKLSRHQGAETGGIASDSGTTM